MADMIGPLRVLSTWKAAENARHFRLLEVARDVLVNVISLGVLNRAGEAVAANRDDNVTLAANDSLLGWSRGSTIYGPPGSNPRSCTVANDVYMVTRFAPSSDIDSAQVGAFVAGRIAAQQLVCHPFQR